MKIINANIFTPENVFRPGEVEFKDGVIQSVQFSDEPRKSKDNNTMDAKGNYLVPGFIELQVNGGFGFQFTTQNDSIWEVAEKITRFGVTSFLPTIITSPLETVTNAQAVVTKDPGKDFVGASPLGLHVEGPFLNPIKKGAHPESLIQPPSLKSVEDWSLDNGIRLVTLAPENPNALDVVKALVKRGVIVSAGHSNATYAEAMQGFEAGITYGTHIFNAQSPLHHREPGLVGALLSTKSISVGIIPDSYHVHPAAVDIVWEVKGSQHLTLVSDAIEGLGLPPATYGEGEYAIIVDETAARKADGTLAGSILGEDQALRNLMKFSGCSLEKALPTLTSTPARVINLTDRGKIEKDCIADLVVLDKNLQVVTTIAAGKVAYQK